jgi:Flp pilus assembly protein TadG
MRNRNQVRRRRGTQAVEAAVVLPVMLLLLLGLIVGGMGVFRYQQVAWLAQEAARWTCVRGGDYQKDTNANSPTQDQVLQQAVLPLATGMDTSQLALKVQWIDQGTNTIQDWDSAPKDIKSLNGAGEYVTNTLRTTITYNWSPGLFLGTVTLTSVCEVPMSN